MTTAPTSRLLNDRGGRLRVTGGKTLSEYMFSELLLTADIGACSRGPESPEIMHWPISFSSISIDLGI
jgi:hypothetical protein